MQYNQLLTECNGLLEQRQREEGYFQNEVRVTKSVGKAFTQADGATVYLHEITPGRFNAVVEGGKV